MKKCKQCGAPLEGFFYNTLGKLLGLKPSSTDPELCNKCEAKGASADGEEPTAESGATEAQAQTEPRGEVSQPTPAEPPVTEQPSEPVSEVV